MISDLPFYDIFVPQKLPLWKSFGDVISCDLWFRPPTIKNSGYANELEIAWKNIFEDLFFLENACACVLGPWPREVLSSETLSLALASDFFCVLGLEPCVLDSTSARHNLYCAFTTLRVPLQVVAWKDKQYGVMHLIPYWSTVAISYHKIFNHLTDNRFTGMRRV